VSRIVFVDLTTHGFPLRRQRCSDHPDWPLTRQPEPPYHQSNNNRSAIMSHTGTMRGTPKPNRNQAAAGAQFNHSPSSIPRPALDSHASHVAQSEAGGSTLSASRAKMSKRDEVSNLSKHLPILGSSVHRQSDVRSKPT
jgi:hypothetical protein